MYCVNNLKVMTRNQAKSRHHGQEDWEYSPSSESQGNLGMRSPRRSKKGRRNKGCGPGNTRYFWNEDENMRYRGFLRDNMGILTQSTQERRLGKVHVKMSRYVRSRTSKQCRSHHQKMLKHHGSLEGILEYFSRKECKGEVSEVGTMTEEDGRTQKKDNFVGTMMEIKDVHEGMPNLWDQMIAESWGCIC